VYIKKELFPIHGVIVTCINNNVAWKGCTQELFLIYGEIVTCKGNKCTPGKGVQQKELLEELFP
jgi:hypothetical protein